MEQIVAKIAYSQEDEQKLNAELSLVEIQADSIFVTDAESFQAAADFGRVIKQKQALVKEFFEPLKKAANAAHKAVCAKEKSALAPLASAEAIIKQRMTDYTIEQERIRRAAEEELRRKQQEEAAKKAAEAAALEAAGKTEEANAAMAEAVAVESISQTLTVQQEAPKATGAAVKRDWEVTIVDESAVPVSIAGAVIRPVDLSAVKSLVRASKGQISIPGITITETANITLRK